MADKTIGLFVKRKNVANPVIKELQAELLLYLFEAQVMLQAMDNLSNYKLLSFDAQVGDQKCQTRTSIIIDLLGKDSNALQTIPTIQNNLKSLITKIEKQLLIFNFEKLKITAEIIKTFKYSSMLDFMNAYQFSLNPPKEFVLISLCLIIKSSPEDLSKFTKISISREKLAKLKAWAKIELCKLSIDYEKKLAQTCGLIDEQKILTQIELKPFSSDFISMTALFPSFNVIFKKMKNKEQPFLQKKIILCQCGGILHINTALYKAKNQTFVKTTIDSSIKKAIMVIEGYTFNGSWEQLKILQNLPADAYPVSSLLQKICKCDTPTAPINILNNIEDIILACFVQHPQFINNAEINFQHLNLENSKFKAKYDYLQNVIGCNIENMSTFCISHIYASTIADVLKEQEELQKQLGLPVTNK